MHFVLSLRSEKGGFRSPLRAAHRAAMEATNHVQAAVAYVSTLTNPVIADCVQRGIRLEVWSRHDASLPTALPVLDWANKRMKTDANFTWRLVGPFYHPKVIWWHGYGVYIGSANLTDAAWNTNSEAGVVILESELGAAELRQSLEDFFSDVHAQSHALNDAVCADAERLRQGHAEIEALRRKNAADFKESETGRQFAQDSLADVSRKPAADVRRTQFLKEWNDSIHSMARGSACPRRG